MPILSPPDELHALPPQPADVPWPTHEWPTGDVPAAVDAAGLDATLDRAFGPDPDPGFGESHAAVIVHAGRIVAERYGPGTDLDTPLLSWSMAKSVTHALVGILVEQGRLDPHEPLGVPEWRDPDDPRGAITLHQALRMVDGLEFNETYAIPEDPEADVALSHCIDMLFGEGRADHGAYTAARPAIHPPDTVFNYSSGTSNLIARRVCDVIGRGDEATAWMHQHLFGPIGMTSAVPGFDEAGNFVGSSYVHATARDWARFGLLHLRGGRWGDRQVVPADWVDDGRTTRAVDEEGNHYGAHWWTAPDGRGRFWASGFGYQRVVCVPATDLVVVRLGNTAEDDYETPRVWMDELVACFDPVRPDEAAD